jgi:Uma2 family endonuclease
MSVAVSKSMTLAEFLSWEERQPLRYEFDGLRPVAMTGGMRAHAAIQANLAIAIGGRLRGGPCRFYGSDLKIRTGDHHIRYPDGFVACTPGEATSTVVSDPVVIFEVLSPATAAWTESSRRGNIKPRLPCSAMSCWSRIASALLSTPALATAGRRTF